MFRRNPLIPLVVACLGLAGWVTSGEAHAGPSAAVARTLAPNAVPPPAARLPYDAAPPRLSLAAPGGGSVFEGVTFWPSAVASGHGYRPVYAPPCHGPCKTQLAPSVYPLALSSARGRAVPARDPVTAMVSASTTDHVDCDSDGYCFHRVDGPVLAGGIGLVVASSVIGSILLFHTDEAWFTVTPLSMPTPTRHEVPIGSLAAQPPPQGAALALHF